jgi:methylated-DNA-[protein]-cysteine S-methyltransferase
MLSESSIFETPVGPLLAVAREGQLIQLSFHHRQAQPVETKDQANARNAELLEAVEAQIAEYFARTRAQFDLPLNLQGPAFHRRVWAALCEIPYGQTVSYGELAAELGDPGLARAVGTANGANPIAIIVPCHRVIGADGSLVGYGGGLDRKRILLDLESHSVQLAL